MRDAQMTHRIILVVAMLLARRALAAAIDYSDFSSTVGLKFNGNGADPSVASNRLRLTTDGMFDEVSSVWYNAPINLNSGFTTTFTYMVNSSGIPWGGSFAFVIQND